MSDFQETTLREANETRKALFLKYRFALEELAVQAITDKGLSIDKFEMVCVSVNDPFWEDLINFLINNDDQKQLLNKDSQVITASVVPELCENIAELIPELERAMLVKLPEGAIRVFIFDAGGISIRALDFGPDQITN